MKIGKRIFTLKRMLNNKLGSSRDDDRLPEFMLKPFAEGGTMGFSPDLDTLLTGAYQEHGWDEKTGTPTQKTLEELDLGFIISK